MSTCLLNDSLINMKKKNLKERISKEGEMPIKKSKTNKKKFEFNIKFQRQKRW